MRSAFFKDFGIPDVDCSIEVKPDNLGVPRLWFNSAGNPPVGPDLTGASQLRQQLAHANDVTAAAEIDQHITNAQAGRFAW
jgi:hypothetical protein